MADEWERWWRKRGDERLGLLLWAVWNPIGPVPLDEYVNYTGQVVGVLRQAHEADQELSSSGAEVEDELQTKRNELAAASTTELATLSRAFDVSGWGAGRIQMPIVERPRSFSTGTSGSCTNSAGAGEPRLRGHSGALAHMRASLRLMEEIEPRPLTRQEATALDFMLSAEFPGVEELRAQAPTVRVIRQCTCGCPTIDLAVDEANTPPALRAVPGVVATAAIRDDPRREDPPFTHLMLWVEGDHLASLELAWLEGPPREFPPPDAFDPPMPG